NGGDQTTLNDDNTTVSDQSDTDTNVAADELETNSSADETSLQADTPAPVEARAAATDDIASGTYGDSAWRIDSNGVLHISGGTFVNTNGKNPWATYADKIKEITFEDQVIAAADSSGLFKNLTNLTTINNANNLNTSNVTNMQEMFSNDSALTSLDISQWDTSKVTNMSLLFLKVSALTNLDVSNWNTSKVTNMYGT
ncbi:BspA family leucine-rich repeat surface protein, partial [Enterococcus faecium]